MINNPNLEVENDTWNAIAGILQSSNRVARMEGVVTAANAERCQHRSSFACQKYPVFN